jgi:hypothetical protein
MSIAEEVRKRIEGKDGINYILANSLLDRLEPLEKNIKATENAEHFRVHPKNPSIQKLTVAGKLYKDYSASYRDYIIKIYKILCDAGDEESASPLREFLNSLGKK